MTCLNISKELSKMTPVSFIYFLLKLSIKYCGNNSFKSSLSNLFIESKNDTTFSSKIFWRTSSRNSFFVLFIIFQKGDSSSLIDSKLFIISVPVSITFSIMILNNWELFLIKSLFSNIFLKRSFLNSSSGIFKYSFRKIKPKVLYILNFLLSFLSNFLYKNWMKFSKFWHNLNPFPSLI